MSGALRCDSPLVDDFVPSPNFGDRRGKAIDALILHYTGMASGDAALARLTSAASGVSSHYLVWEDGRITQLVAERERAWHAGIGKWAGDGDLNTISVGIEIINRGHDGGAPPYPDAQIDSVITLCRDICRRLSIPAHRVLAHSDVAPARKRDPGEMFPWARLAAAGVGVWVEAPPPDPTSVVAPGEAGPLVAATQERLREIGYDCASSGVLDPATIEVLVAFQRHYRPSRVDGRLDASSMATLKALWDIIPQNLRAG